MDIIDWGICIEFHFYRIATINLIRVLGLKRFRQARFAPKVPSENFSKFFPGFLVDILGFLSELLHKQTVVTLKKDEICCPMSF